MTLADILGYDELDLVVELIANRWTVVRAATVPKSNGIARNDGLQTREERDETLRRQDWEHKNAALAPASRPGIDGGSEGYPHVYRSHEAGNALSAHGRKYALPMGSVHHDHEV